MYCMSMPQVLCLPCASPTTQIGDFAANCHGSCGSSGALFFVEREGLTPMSSRELPLTRTSSDPCIVSSLLLVVSLISFIPASPAWAQGGKTEVFPVQKAAPATVFIEASGNETDLRHQLRVKNGVSQLSSSTSVIRFSAAPTGSFGFIPPKLLGMALITRSPDLPIEQIPPAPDAFEIHKLADGSGMLVGFVEPRLKSHLSASERPKNVRLGLYSNPSDKA